MAVVFGAIERRAREFSDSAPSPRAKGGCKFTANKPDESERLRVRTETRSLKRADFRFCRKAATGSLNFVSTCRALYLPCVSSWLFGQPTRVCWLGFVVVWHAIKRAPQAAATTATAGSTGCDSITWTRKRLSFSLWMSVSFRLQTAPTNCPLGQFASRKQADWRRANANNLHAIRQLVCVVQYVSRLELLPNRP